MAHEKGSNIGSILRLVGVQTHVSAAFYVLCSRRCFTLLLSNLLVRIIPRAHRSTVVNGFANTIDDKSSVRETNREQYAN